MRCVIVEDNPRTADRLRAVLERMGHQVLPVATSVTGALRIVDADRIDCTFVKPGLERDGEADHALFRLGNASALVWLGGKGDAGHPSLSSPFGRGRVLEAMAQALLVRLHALTH
jgi:hypothetical protein